MEAAAAVPPTPPSKDIHHLFGKLKGIIEEYECIVKQSEENSKKGINSVTKEYKEKLRQALKLLDSEPLASANLSKPTYTLERLSEASVSFQKLADALERLSEKSKELQLKEKEKLNGIMDEFKKKIRVNVGSMKSIHISVPSNPNQAHVPVLEFDTGGKLRGMFWVANWKYVKYNCYGSTKRPLTHRPNITVIRFGSFPSHIIPFQVKIDSNGKAGDVPLGQDPVQDKLWFELVDFVRPI